MTREAAYAILRQRTQEFCDGGSLAQAIDKGTFVDTHTGQRNMAHIIQVAGYTPSAHHVSVARTNC